MAAVIHFGAKLVAEIDEPVHWSIHGASRALAKHLTRSEYRRVFASGNMLVTGRGTSNMALFETKNADGTPGATYSILGDK